MSLELLCTKSRVEVRAGRAGLAAAGGFSVENPFIYVFYYASLFMLDQGSLLSVLRYLEPRSTPEGCGAAVLSWQRWAGREVAKRRRLQHHTPQVQIASVPPDNPLDLSVLSATKGARLLPCSPSGLHLHSH